MVSKRGIERFQRQLLQLEPVEFVGVCRILGIQLVSKNEETGENTPIPFDEVFAALMDKYEELSRLQRRNLNKLLRPATKGKEKA